MTEGSIVVASADTPFLRGLQQLAEQANAARAFAVQQEAALFHARQTRAREIVEHTRERFRNLAAAAPVLGAQIEYTCETPPEDDVLPAVHTLHWRAEPAPRRLEIMVSALTGRYWFRAVAPAGWLTPAHLPIDEQGSDILGITTDHIDQLICVLADGAAWRTPNIPNGFA